MGFSFLSTLQNFFLKKGRHRRIKFYELFHRYALKFLANKVVRYHYDDIVINLPFKHMLPILKARFPYYDTFLKRLINFIEQSKKIDTIKLIDVGANVGDTYLLIGKPELNVLLVEPDESYFKLLQKNVAHANTVCVRTPLTDENIESVGQPQTRHVKGTAFLANNSGVTFDWLLSQKDYKQFATADIFKIDTDGFDFKVLRGSVEYLKREEPILYFEFSPEHYIYLAKDNPVEIFTYLINLNYSTFLIYDSEGFLLMELNSAIDKIEKIILNLTKYCLSKSRYLDIAAFTDKRINGMNLGSFISKESNDVFPPVRRKELMEYTTPVRL